MFFLPSLLRRSVNKPLSNSKPINHKPLNLLRLSALLLTLILPVVTQNAVNAQVQMKTTREPSRPIGPNERTTVTYVHYYKGFLPHQEVIISDTSGGYYTKQTLPANECGIVSVSFPSKYKVQDGVG